MPVVSRSTFPCTLFIRPQRTIFATPESGLDLATRVQKEITSEESASDHEQWIVQKVEDIQMQVARLPTEQRQQVEQEILALAKGADAVADRRVNTNGVIDTLTNYLPTAALQNTIDLNEAGDQFEHELSRIVADAIGPKEITKVDLTKDIAVTLDSVDLDGIDMFNKGILKPIQRTVDGRIATADGKPRAGEYYKYLRAAAMKAIREGDWTNRAATNENGLTEKGALAVAETVGQIADYATWEQANPMQVVQYDEKFGPEAPPVAPPPAAEPPPPAPEANVRSPEHMINGLDAATVLGKKTELLNMLAVSHPDIQPGEWPAVTKDIADTLGITVNETDAQARQPNSLTHKLGERIQILVYGAKKDGELGRTSVRDFQEFLKTGQQIKPPERHTDTPSSAPVRVTQAPIDSNAILHADFRPTADAVPDRDRQLAAIEGARAAAMAAAAEAIQKDIPDGRFDNKLTGIDFADRADVQTAFVALRDAAQLISAGEIPDQAVGEKIMKAISTLDQRIAANANGPDILSSNTRAMEAVRSQLQTHLEHLRSIERDAQKARAAVGSPQPSVGPSATPMPQRPSRRDTSRVA